MLLLLEFFSRLLGNLSLFLKLFVQLLDDIVLVIIQQRQILNMHIGILQFFFKLSNFTFLLIHDD